MSLNVIDLVSSSPSPLSHHLKRAAEASNSSHHAEPTAQALLSADSDLLSLSDQDFDELLFDLGESCRKRRRTSPASRPVTVAPSLASRPPLVLSRNAPLRPRAPDPIEVSSSMELASPKDRPHAASEDMVAAPSRVAAAYVDSDPFASSPDPARHKNSRMGPPVRRAVSLDPFVGSSSPMGVISLSPRRFPARKQVSSIADSSPAAQCLSELDHDQRHRAASTSSRLARRSKQPDVISIDSSSSDGTNDSDFPDIPIRSNRDPSRLDGKHTADQKQKRATESAAGKERKRYEREQAKEARAREKEHAAALAEANKLRTDKKVSTPEMIVNLASSLGFEHTEQVQTLLSELGVDHVTWESPVHGIVKWRRKVTCHFDLDLGRWEPIPPHIQEEKHVLAIFTAEEFVGSVLNNELEAHARKVREHFSGHQVIYILQGITPWMRKNRKVRNRQFASGVRVNQAPKPIQGRQRRRDATEYIPEDQVEDAMLRLQMGHGVFIHHTATSIETAKWVVTFTQYISTIPYRKQKDHATSSVGFCMESGQVRTGDGPKDTYVRMLQEIVRITAPIAYGVANEFASLSQLVRGLENGGPERLESVKKSANKDGQLSDRVIGQAVSRRLYKVFTGCDELSTDI
ncbi:ERCC4 domain-containing protein [Hirsutella rhossiliensis]|uniref:ERCC4 domain-containing protein n=1 Tax=Hirsutella rhossiliensis TaxID=111463 RepID=A0A9P8SKA9_9HYPO|nr:ERCC4 domain-containing protein [Hirsutella rhossiliensis]KAH0966168.1 ERCC4 domain-containing protein [Hirsutella rhossiliensis]